MLSFISRIQNMTEELIYEVETDSQTYHRQTCGCQGVGVGKGWPGRQGSAGALCQCERGTQPSSCAKRSVATVTETDTGRTDVCVTESLCLETKTTCESTILQVKIKPPVGGPGVYPQSPWHRARTECLEPGGQRAPRSAPTEAAHG